MKENQLYALVSSRKVIPLKSGSVMRKEMASHSEMGLNQRAWQNMLQVDRSVGLELSR